MKEMRNRLLHLLGIALVFLLTGCAANRAVSQLQQQNMPPLQLAFNVQEVQITDSRANQSSADIQLPFVSKPNTLIKHVPALTATHKQLIENVIQENTTKAGAPVKAILYLQDSYKEFAATWSREKERGYAQVQITLVHQESGALLASCDSSGDVFVQSIDATHERMEEIYQLTMKNVIYNCLKSMAGQVKE